MSDVATPLGPGSYSSPPPRSNWKQTIKNSGLPNEVQLLITMVVKKSRLLSFEKSDVAADLVSHFQDGKNRGQTYPRLVEEFGDLATTACLIRRSKLRNRSMMLKVFKGLGIGAMLFSTVYLVIAGVFHLGKTNPIIDYAVDFNGPIVNVDDELKAWPIYRAVWTKFDFCEGPGSDLSDLYVTLENGDQEMIRAADENWPEAIAFLEEYDELIVATRLAAKLPVLGLELKADATEYSDEDFAALFPSKTKATYDAPTYLNVKQRRIMDGAIINILLPHVQTFRNAARIFYVDTRYAMVQGDSQRAVENIQTIFGMANHASETRCLVSSLVGFAVATIGFDVLEEVMIADPDFFSEEQLATLQSNIEKISFPTWLHYEGERAFIKDLVQRCYTDNGNGNGRMTADGIEVLTSASLWISNQQAIANENETYASVAKTVLGPASLFLVASRKEVIEKTDEFIDHSVAQIYKPFWKVERLPLDDFFKENKLKHVLLGMVFPATEQVEEAMRRTAGYQEGVIAALAIHRFYKKYDQWPEQFDQVAPEFVAEFPYDPIDGSMIKFKYDDDELKVYSVGIDKTDEGGTPFEHQHNPFGSLTSGHVGDWILWPRNVEEIENSEEADSN
jgi:hypothetical protein